MEVLKNIILCSADSIVNSQKLLHVDVSNEVPKNSVAGWWVGMGRN